MAKHYNLRHMHWIPSATDPGAVGADKGWIDTSGGTGNWALKVRNAANSDWEALASGGGGGTPGADGADGLSVLNGAGAPGAGVGVDGEFYIDTTNWDIYGPKAGGAWGSGTSLIGPEPSPNITQTMVLSAAGGWPSTTAGCAAPALSEMATNKQNLYLAAFDKDTQEHIEWTAFLPDNYDGGTITAQFLWSHGTADTNFGVVWGLQARAYANDAALDQAWGTAQEVTDTGGTANDLYLTATTGAITIGGSPAGGQLVQFRAYRKAGDVVNDTLAVDANLLAVKIEYGVNAWSA